MKLYIGFADSSFAVNCGGRSITSSTGTVYEEDNKSLGAASYNVTNPIRWAVGNVGRFAENINATYISNSQSQFTSTLDSELFQTARLSPVSLRYYGLGLENGNYTISLQFVETAFEYSQTWQSVGRRIFDIYVQVCIVKLGCTSDFLRQKYALRVTSLSRGHRKGCIELETHDI